MASCHVPVKQFPIADIFFKKHVVFSAISLLRFHWQMQKKINKKQKTGTTRSTEAPIPALTLRHLKRTFFGKLWKASVYQQQASVCGFTA